MNENTNKIEYFFAGVPFFSREKLEMETAGSATFA